MRMPFLFSTPFPTKPSFSLLCHSSIVLSIIVIIMLFHYRFDNYHHLGGCHNAVVAVVVIFLGIYGQKSHCASFLRLIYPIEKLFENTFISMYFKSWQVKSLGELVANGCLLILACFVSAEISKKKH